MKHYITKYEEGGQWYAEAWSQINLFGKCFCFWKRRIPIDRKTVYRLGEDIKEIVVTTNDDELLVSITDSDIISSEDVKVILT